MGVDCKIMLPSNVQVREIANVIGICVGLNKHQEKLDGCDFEVTRVDGIDVKGIEILPGCAEISWSNPVGISPESIKHTGRVLYHYEYDGGKRRLLSPRACSEWLAIGEVLVNFFGGEIDYQDCDASELDYLQPAKTDVENCPEDGEEWQDLQDRLFALEPLTDDDIAEFDLISAYGRQEQ